ncbi:MAG: peptidylprolyl isomerase, partial [Myxococcales bacterium]|nr:peptidylprolyl isomerase [Myxococcales bacterium]
MKTPWTLLCCVVLAAALTACKSSAPAPTEGEPEAEATAATDEAAKTEAAASPVEKPVATPDIPAPPDVVAAPKDAKRSESGLAWTVLKEGEGDKHPGELDIVTVNYTGWTTEGRMFDSSVK